MAPPALGRGREVSASGVPGTMDRTRATSLTTRDGYGFPLQHVQDIPNAHPALDRIVINGTHERILQEPNGEEERCGGAGGTPPASLIGSGATSAQRRAVAGEEDRTTDIRRRIHLRYSF